MSPVDFEKLKSKVDRFEAVLDKERFTVYDLDEDCIEPQGAIQYLNHHGAIEKVGTKPGGDKGYVFVWKWVKCREQLKEYYEERTEFPCGHRAHIHNPPGSAPDEFGCKFCDERRMYSEELVRELL